MADESLFNPEVLARLEAERAQLSAEHDFLITLGANLSFDEALAKAKQEMKAKKLHLRGWDSHPNSPGFYYRSTSDGGFESKPESALLAMWPSVELCESPIEVALYEALVGSPLYGYQLQLQCDVVCVDRYRLDFAFHTPRRRSICVEADGHNYHERTKEQAQHDRQRDRRLTYAGWNVLRFTGSEIFRDAAACAREVVEHLGLVSLG